MMLTLVRKDYCHLCDDAKTILTEAGASFELAELSSNAQWQKDFAEAIPVVIAPDQRVLRWPFTVADVHRLVNHPESDA